MKRLILLTGLLIFSGAVVSAQTTGSHSSNSTTHSTLAENKKTKKGKKVRYSQLNQRKIYHWKSGQRATPTGQEATPLGSGYASLRKDTATVTDPKKRMNRILHNKKRGRLAATLLLLFGC